MTSELRNTEITVVSDVPWGTHFCHFYETKQDLLDTLLPYFKTGLESNECCLWVISDNDLITSDEATKALAEVVPDLDRHLSDGNIEIVSGHQWYFEKNALNLERVRRAWDTKLKQALAGGYVGLRASADTFWLAEKDLKDFCHYEKQVDDWVTDQRMKVLCTYPLAKSEAAGILDVLRVHQFATARRQGEWQVIQSPESRQAQTEIKRLNEELQKIARKTPQPPFVLRFGVAILAVIVALIINRLLNVNMVGAPAMLFLCALMFSAWYGGAKPSLLAMPIAVVGFAYYFVTPVNSWIIDVREIPRLSLFVLASVFVISLSAAQKRAAESLRQARDVLAGTVDELKRTNQALRTEIVERKQAEAAVRQAEDRIRLVIDTIPTMVWSLEPDGTVDFVNPRWIEYTGFSLEEAITDANAIVYPEDLPQALGKWESNMANGELHEAEMRLRGVDGEYRWFLVRVSPLRDADGKIVKWYGVSLDIEDRKKAEIAAWALIDAIPQQIWSAPPDGKNDYVNERWRAETGLGPEDGRGDGWQILLHPDDRDRVLKAWEYSVRHGTPYAQEARHRSADGTYRWYLNRGVPQRDSDGQILRWYGTYTDIEDRKRAEEELTREKEVLKKIFENIPVMIGFVGQDGVKLVNPEWERSIGWTLKELQEQNVDIFVEAYPDPSYRQEVLDFVAASTGEWADLKIKVRDGRVIDAACAVVRLSDGTRVAIARDITESKRAEDENRRLLRELAERVKELTALHNAARVLQQEQVDTASVLRELGELLPPAFRHSEITAARIRLGPVEATTPGFADSPSALRADFMTADGQAGSIEVVHTEAPTPAAETPFLAEERSLINTLADMLRAAYDRRQAEEQLRATSMQMRALSASLSSAREEEGTRIARAIHDELGSAVTSLNWELEKLDKTISEATDVSRSRDLKAMTTGMMRLTEQLMGTIRRIASELRPSILDDLGLAEAIEWQAQEFQTRTGIVCRCDCSIEHLDFNPEQSTAIFRILQEALTNVRNHANATEVEVVAREQNDEFVLTITDNGRGITEDEKLDRRSLGILGMQERAHIIGGDVEITGIEGKGTAVTVRVPI